MVDVSRIVERIETAVRQEWWTGRLAASVAEAVALRPSAQPWQGGEVQFFVEQYVRWAPRLLELLAAEGERSGREDQLRPLLDAALGYWEWQADFLPDDLGLIGLADDAYLTLRLVERWSETAAAGGDGVAAAELATANLQMAGLLGPRLVARLDEAVEATLQRMCLQGTLTAIAGTRFRIPPGPASPCTLPDAAVVEDAVRVATKPAADDASKPEERRGNVSLIALTVAVGLFTLWQVYFRFPLDSTISILGWGGIELAWLDRGRGVILTSLGLSALLSGTNWRKFFTQSPYRSVESAELRRFFAARATLAFSVLVLALTLYVCSTNVSVLVEARPEHEEHLEVLVRVSGTDDAFLFRSGTDEEVGRGPWRQARLTSDGEPLRLALRGGGAATALVVRDKYSLSTLEGLWLRRRPWAVEVSQLALHVPPPTGLDRAERKA